MKSIRTSSSIVSRTCLRFYAVPRPSVLLKQLDSSSSCSTRRQVSTSHIFPASSSSTPFYTTTHHKKSHKFFSTHKSLPKEFTEWESKEQDSNTTSKKGEERKRSEGGGFYISYRALSVAAASLVSVILYTVYFKPSQAILFTEQHLIPKEKALIEPIGEKLVDNNNNNNNNKNLATSTHGGTSELVDDMNIKVKVRTSLNENPIDRLIVKINSAQTSIKAAVYKFYNDEVYSALVDALGRGVKIRLVCDKKANNRARSRAFALQAQGASVVFWDLSRLPKLHAKFTILDNSYVLTGSSNWTDSADSGNLELVLEFSGDVSEFCDTFDELWKKVRKAHA